MKKQCSAQVFKKEQRKHEGNHGAISNQHQQTQKGDHEMGEPPEREKRDYRLCAGGRECVKGDPVAGIRHNVPVEDGIQANAKLQKHDQRKEPRRKLVSAIRIVDALGEKPVEHWGAPVVETASGEAWHTNDPQKDPKATVRLSQDESIVNASKPDAGGQTWTDAPMSAPMSTEATAVES